MPFAPSDSVPLFVDGTNMFEIQNNALFIDHSTTLLGVIFLGLHRPLVCFIKLSLLTRGSFIVLFPP